MARSITLPTALLLALALAGCGSSAGSDHQTAAKPSSPTPSSGSTPSSAAPTAAGEVASFDVAHMCKDLDRSLAKKVIGPVLGRDVALKQGDRSPTSGAPVQGATCVLEGGKGQVETSVFVVPYSVTRRKSMDVSQLNGCTNLEPKGKWDKAFDCKDGPILIRNGTASVFTCSSSSKMPDGVANGRAVCEDLLGKIS